MKGKIFFFAATAMALMSSCSSDEVVDVNPGNAISFSTTVGKPSRAAATTTNDIQNFKVWAFTNGETYMGGLTVTKTNGKWSYGLIKFWPETAVDFFAVSPTIPASGTVSVTTEGKTITNYVANGSEDLLYAANISETKKSAPVAVNFRHALSQVVFQVAKTSDEDYSAIKVNVNGIKIEGIANQGTLTWATATTGAHLATVGDNDTETGDTWGNWTGVTGNQAYPVASLENALEVTTAAQELEANSGLFLMPQTLMPWLDKDGKVIEGGKARILVSCNIVDETSGVQLWPVINDGEDKGGFAEVAVTLSNPTSDPNGNDAKHNCWMQGKKYIYTLIFGKGAGYNPDPEPGNDPDPVLVPITFEVTVDEFQNGGEYFPIDPKPETPATPAE